MINDCLSLVYYCCSDYALVNYIYLCYDLKNLYNDYDDDFENNDLSPSHYSMPFGWSNCSNGKFYEKLIECQRYPGPLFLNNNIKLFLMYLLTTIMIINFF